MKDITPIIQARFKAKNCSHEKGCRCYAAACMEAYIETVIPEEYHSFTIDNFEGIIEEEGEKGKKKKVTVLDSVIVAAAKKQLIDYCWKDIKSGEDYDSASWLVRSVLDKRRMEGSSLVIYGPKWVADKALGKYFHKASGKTMLAAIVMKEIIKMRLLPGHTADSYAWIEYTPLINRLIAKSQGDNTHNEVIDNYSEVDWLVVDGFSVLDKGSDAQKSYRANVLDRVFSERREAGLPSILVFQDDIKEMADFQEQFGTALNSTVSSKKTKRISLCEGK